MNAHQELVIRLLNQARGDGLARVRRAFRNCTPEQMREQYGESGKTRQQILDEYEAYDARIDAAIEWVTSV